MLVTSIFFFSHNVFYPIKDNFNILSNILICCLQMLSIWARLKFCHLVKGFPQGLKTKYHTYYLTIFTGCHVHQRLIFYAPRKISGEHIVATPCLCMLVRLSVRHPSEAISPQPLDQIL